MERVSGEHARAGGRKNGAALERSQTPETGRLAGERKRAPELSDEPAVRGLARPAVQVRAAGDLTVWIRHPGLSMVESRCELPRSRRWPKAFRPSFTAAPSGWW